jgi:hypothetical protein
MVMPDFASLPTGWTTDRYEPHGFSNVGTYQGRSDVLGIEINRAEGATARPPGFGSQFYDTQGRQHALAGAGVGSILGASLHIDSSWLDAANGNVRTDAWGVLANAGNAITDYTVVGFTNYGGAPRLRVFDADVGGDGWVDLPTALAPDAWVDLAMELTPTSIVYSVDGSVVYTDSTIGGDHFSAVIMQAYNFFDPANFPDAVAENYTAHWSNIGAEAVPEPATALLIGGALLAAGAARRRRTR